MQNDHDTKKNDSETKRYTLTKSYNFELQLGRSGFKTHQFHLIFFFLPFLILRNDPKVAPVSKIVSVKGEIRDLNLLMCLHIMNFLCFRQKAIIAFTL